MKEMPTITSTRILYAVLATVSVAAFALSFRALADLAGAHDMSMPMLFPLIVDAAAIGLAVAAFRASMAGREGVHYSALVLAFTAISAALNVAEVWEGSGLEHGLRYAIHALPPIVSFIMLEVLLHEIRHGREERGGSFPGRIIPPVATKGKRGRKPGTPNAPVPLRDQAQQQGLSLRTFYRRRATTA